MHLKFTRTFIDAQFRGRKRSPRKGNSIDLDPLLTGGTHGTHCEGADLKAFWGLEVFSLDHTGLMKYSPSLGGVSGISKSRGGALASLKVDDEIPPQWLHNLWFLLRQYIFSQIWLPPTKNKSLGKNIETIFFVSKPQQRKLPSVYFGSVNHFLSLHPGRRCGSWSRRTGELCWE